MIKETLFGLLSTLGLYGIFFQLHKKYNHILLHPNIISILILILFLSITQIPYEAYNQGGQYINGFLGICIVVLAVPMYENRQILANNFKPMVLTSLWSIYVSFLSIFLLAKLLNLPKYLIISFLPKSITTAMAIEGSALSGGIPGITILGVMVTGIGGAIIGRSILTLVKVSSPMARGCALGMASHVMGTTQALEEGSLTGAYSALSIPINGVLTILHLPLFHFLIQKFY